MTVDNELRTRQPLDFHRTSPLAPAAPSASRSAADPAAALQRTYERLSDAPHYTEFLRNIGSKPDALRSEIAPSEHIADVRSRNADAAARAGLDGFRDRFSGPYVVNGESIRARPMFRMNTGFNDAKMTAHQPELFAISTKAGCRGAVGPACCGRPNPDQLVRVTRALIDAGKLPSGGGSLELRIRQMQWEWGIGVDCAGYTEGAAAAARGKGVQPTTGDAFADLARSSSMRKVDVAHVRPGDVIHLDPPKRNEVGHNVVVYDRRPVDDARRQELAARATGVAEFLSGPGPVQALLVDSSWGAGDGNDFGGFRRDTWLYDEGTRRWGYFEHGSGEFSVSARGPHDEPYTGAFRPKEAS